MKKSALFHSICIAAALVIITGNLPAMIKHSQQEERCEQWIARERRQIKKLKRNIKRFVQMQQIEHSNRFNWLHDRTPCRAWYNTAPTDSVSDYTTFFVEKKEAMQNTRLIVFGDIHGCDFEAIDIKCQEEGVWDRNHEICSEHQQIIFLGDYLEKGRFPFTTLNKILEIKAKNSSQTTMLRGNHEEDFVDRYFSERRPATTNTYNILGSDDSSKKTLAWLKEHLPAALYLRVPGISEAPYLLFCHGTPEPGHSPYELLNSDAHFENITELNRKNFCDHFYNFEIVAFDARRVDGDLELMGQDFITRHNKDNIPTAHRYRNTYWGDRAFLQHIWGYVNDDESKQNGELIKHRIAFSFTREQVEHMLTNPETQRREILSVIRAHQHQDNPDNPMLKRLSAANGYIKHWDGLCHTIISSPRGTKPKRCSAPIGHSSFLIIELTGRPEAWTVTHYNKREDEAEFSQSTYPMLG